MKRIIKLTNYKEVLRRLLYPRIMEAGVSEVSLNQAVGRTLASTVVSPVDIPDKYRSVFDGYAVISKDLKKASKVNPITLRVVGKTFPNEGAKRIVSGETIYVSTGSLLPKGADAVVKVENVRRTLEQIEAIFPIEAGENRADPGEDVTKGSLILKTGHVLRSQDIGMLAGLEIYTVKVLEKPSVGIISVGDELVELTKRKPYHIPNNYALIISNLVKEAGGDPMMLGIVSDDLSQIKHKLEAASKKVDIITTISGCSVGQKDLVPDAIDALGKPGIINHGVNVSPGKVMGWGIVNTKPVVMLPGHIVSTFAAFYLLVIPLIAQFREIQTKALHPVIKVEMTEGLKGKPQATFLRVKVYSENGKWKAKSVHGGASALSTIIKSNGYVLLPPRKTVPKGKKLEVILFSKHELADMTNME